MEPKSLADHAPTCQFVKRRNAERADIKRILKRYKPKGASGKCPACGERVVSLLGHLRACKGRPETSS